MTPVNRNRYASLLTVSLLVATSLAQKNLDVPWSKTSYGPDGPWQAVQITVGGNDSDTRISSQNTTNLDVYPGGSFAVFTFSSEACAEFQNDTHCGEGGTWEADADEKNVIAYTEDVSDKATGLFVEAAGFRRRGLTIAGNTVWNTSLRTADTGNITYFDGQHGGMRLGYLSLGAPDDAQVFTLSEQDKDQVTAEIFNSKLFKDKVIPSYSYSLQIGSAALSYPGSLVFGGYNRGRVIGPLTSFPEADTVDLLDISIGTETGGSPFSGDKALTGLLVNSKDEINKAVNVVINPRTPYLSLPEQTCKALAQVLPIKFDDKTKYYLWQTDKPLYKSIVTSPSYLAFTFPPGLGASKNVTIKVPFALLNLTLDTPIVDKPTQYFPCVPYNAGSDESFELGRAFLQAAFVGRNWRSKITWLGQAPGPGYNGAGLGNEFKDISDDATSVDAWPGEGDTNYFNQSWTGHWTPLPGKSNNNQSGGSGSGGNGGNDNGNGSGGLATGAKAGIGAGVAVAALGALGLGFFLWRRKQRQTSHGELDGHEAIAQQPPYSDSDMIKYAHNQSGSPDNTSSLEPQELATGVAPVHAPPQELGTGHEMQELPDRSDPRMA